MRELTSASVPDQNPFEHPDVIKSPQEKPVALRGRTFTQTVPAHSLQSLVLDLS